MSAGRLKLLLDLVALPPTLAPGIAAWTAVALGLVHVGPAFVVLAPLVLVVVFLVALALLRALVPTPRPGHHPLALSRDVLGWYLHLALSRAAKVAGLRYLLCAFATTRWLMLRALGGKVAFDTNFSLEFTLVDLPLLTIGPRTTLGEHAYVGAHLFRGTTLILEPVTIGADVFVGGRSTIGPGTTLGDGAWIGFGNNLAGETIPPGHRLRDCQWWFGSPERSAKIGYPTAPAHPPREPAASREAGP